MSIQHNAPPPTRIISFLQEVRSADPDYQRGLIRPWWFEFSSGRKFDWRADIYTTTGT